MYACPSVAVDKVIAIKFQKIELPLLIDSNVNISIKPPCSPNAAGSVQTRLLSSKYRHGQVICYCTSPTYDKRNLNDQKILYN